MRIISKQRVKINSFVIQSHGNWISTYQKTENSTQSQPYWHNYRNKSKAALPDWEFQHPGTCVQQTNQYDGHQSILDFPTNNHNDSISTYSKSIAQTTQMSHIDLKSKVFSLLPPLQQKLHIPLTRHISWFLFDPCLPCNARQWYSLDLPPATPEHS